ncbi:MAG: ATP-binding protein [Actinomycetota bacterium]
MSSDSIQDFIAEKQARLDQMREEQEQLRAEAIRIAGPRPADRPCEECGVTLEPVLLDDRWHVGDVCAACVRERERRELHRSRLHLGALEERMTFDAFAPSTTSQRLALEVVRAGGSAWLHGRPGCGKTHLVTAAALSAVGVHVERWAALELMAALRTEARSSEHSEPTMRAVCECELLVLDDLDAPRNTDFTLEQWHRIADARYRGHLRTLITSNLDPRETAARIGARVHSRLVGLCAVVHVEGPDGRRIR